GGVLLEAPGMTSIEFSFQEDFWDVSESHGKALLHFKGIEARTFIITEVTENRITGIPQLKNSTVPDTMTVRMGLDVVHQPNDQPKERLIGSWVVVHDAEETELLKFSEIQIEENGMYHMFGDSLSRSGTWQLSPSGSYFTVSEPEKNDIIFRIESLTEE